MPLDKEDQEELAKILKKAQEKIAKQQAWKRRFGYAKVCPVCRKHFLPHRKARAKVFCGRICRQVATELRSKTAYATRLEAMEIAKQVLWEHGLPRQAKEIARVCNALSLGLHAEIQPKDLASED